jgi:hypothetical protein
MHTKHKILLWLFTHLVVRFMKTDRDLSHEVFGRTLNLFLESQGWKLEFIPELGMRWNKNGLHLFPLNALEQCARRNELERRFSLLPAPQPEKPKIMVLPALPRK